MACNTVAAYINGSCDLTGGVKEWVVYPLLGSNGAPAVIYTRDQTTNVITGATINDLSTAKIWRVEAETSTFTDTKTVSKTDKSKFYAQEATIVFHGTSDVLVEELNKMNGRYCLIAKDNEGKNHLLFDVNGGQIADVFTPGTAMGDAYAHTLKISGNESRKSSIVDDTTFNQITAVIS